MCASVLAFEAIVLGLTTPVMITVVDVEKPAALAVGLGLMAAALAIAALLRFRWAYVLGSLLQVAAVALGFVVPAMFVLGLLFAAAWVMALLLGRRVEVAKRERAAL